MIQMWNFWGEIDELLPDMIQINGEEWDHCASHHPKKKSQMPRCLVKLRRPGFELAHAVEDNVLNHFL